MRTSVVHTHSPGSQDQPLPAVPVTRDPKIHSEHLTRQAVIYVRQSHPNQVLHHPEIARRQYGLTERAHQLGWAAEQVRVIDEDQGKTAAGSAAAHGRDGFADLVSAMGLGDVGPVLVLEVSRLARNSAEWYRLLEFCALSGALIAHDTTVYDPRLFDDRLLLGLRGTISEVELHCIKEQLDGARMSKARQGELSIRLTAGYVGGQDGQIALDPDQEVQGAIRRILAQFERLGTATASRQCELCEPENRLVVRELEGRWNEKLRVVVELEADYRREQDHGLLPFTDEEKTRLRLLRGDVRTL